MKLDGGTGGVLWSQHYASAGDENESVYDMVLDGAGNPIVTGRINISGRLDELCTMKFDNATGDVEWQATEGGAARLDDHALSVALCPTDCPVVAGLIQNSDGTADLMITKYDGANGGSLWARTEAGLVNDQSGDGWVGVDAAGDVIAAWKHWGGATSYDVKVAKYDGDDGTPMWQIAYNHGGASADDPAHMIVDDAGDIFVVGSAAGDFLMVKFSGVDGATLWSDTYEGPQGWYDVANHAMLRPDGNLYVTGFSDGTGTSWDVATLGYDGADGTQLWVERWDGPENSTDEGRSIDVDSQGRLYVSGYAYSNATSMDQLVIAYQLPTDTAVDGLPKPARLAAAPNPFNPRVEIDFALATSGAARLEVFDLQGRRLAVLYDGELGEGGHRVDWDGVDASGRPVPSGTYVARLTAGVDSRTVKLVLAK